MKTLAQAAKSLGVSHATLRQQIKNGKFTATLLGCQYVATPEEIERYRKETRGRKGPVPA